jgi:ammonia channel protein AmtB
MKSKLIWLIALFSPMVLFGADKLDTGDTAWMMVSTAVVLLITPAGLALFYGGMTRSKNVLNTYAMVVGALAVAFLAVKDNDLLWDGPLKESGDRVAQFMVQLESVVVVGLFTLIGTIVVYYIASLLTGGARVDEESESKGLDETQHGETAFNL